MVLANHLEPDTRTGAHTCLSTSGESIGEKVNHTASKGTQCFGWVHGSKRDLGAGNPFFELAPHLAEPKLEWEWRERTPFEVFPEAGSPGYFCKVQIVERHWSGITKHSTWKLFVAIS